MDFEHGCDSYTMDIVPQRLYGQIYYPLCPNIFLFHNVRDKLKKTRKDLTLKKFFVYLKSLHFENCTLYRYQLGVHFFWQDIAIYITIERKEGDKLWELRVIDLLELVIRHNRLAQQVKMKMRNNVTPSHMENYYKV